MFTWFIKEKNLVPNELFDQNFLKNNIDFGDKDSSNYYKAILQNLFFATLNQEMGNREFRKDGQNITITNLYRYKKLFKDENYNRYYYVNTNQEKVYFPNKSLSNVLTSNSINTIKKSLGAQYILSNFKLSNGFEKLNFEDSSDTTLSNFIVAKLQSKKDFYDGLNSIAGKVKSKRISVLLEHVDELKDEVTDYFKTLKL